MIEIKDSDILLAQLMGMENLSEETVSRVSDAEILLFPDAERLFQPNTINFYKYVKHQAPSFKIDILENYDDMKVLVLHSSDFWMPFIFIASQQMLPAVVNLVSDYAADAMKNNERTGIIHLQVTLQEQDKSKTISYEGSPEGLKAAFDQLDTQKIWEG